MTVCQLESSGNAEENQALIGALKVVSFCSAKQALDSRAVPSRVTPCLAGDCEH